ncbi:MAG: XRE family transcriptional regulator [Cytophagia bacterium]|nr:MAG: XRE family transcriptional regulator [Cytophagia bacterium]TAH29046.1 MAG: XRE family transcriptional regulator [Cytophagales bacterium]
MDMKIGDKIKKFREYRGFKQEVLAEKLQMTQAGYSRLERGEVDIPFSRLEQLAKVLDVPLRDLVSFDEQNMITNYISSSQLFTTNGSVIADKEVLAKLEKQYESRIEAQQKEIDRLHSHLEKALNK